MFAKSTSSNYGDGIFFGFDEYDGGFFSNKFGFIDNSGIYNSDYTIT